MLHKTLTHWGWVLHICVSKLTIIGLDNGLSPCRCQAIIWTDAWILLIGVLGTNFSEISIGIQIFSLKKMHFKMLSVEWRPFCLGLNVLIFDRWHRGWAAMTPVKYECDSMDLTLYQLGIFFSKNNLSMLFPINVMFLYETTPIDYHSVSTVDTDGQVFQHQAIIMAFIDYVRVDPGLSSVACLICHSHSHSGTLNYLLFSLHVLLWKLLVSPSGYHSSTLH